MLTSLKISLHQTLVQKVRKSRVQIRERRCSKISTHLGLEKMPLVEEHILGSIVWRR
jgi:hypothetical protein